jgi:uncharacterized protein (TIGR03084 family)
MDGTLMAVDLTRLCADLRAEGDVVVGLLDGLTQVQWHLETPAAGWTIADQVGHLAYFDDAASLALTDPGRFRAEAAAAIELGEDFAGEIALRYRQETGADLLAWFLRSRENLLTAFAGADPGEKLPWYGPSMSPASSLTARIMETWAHGLDIADALGAPASVSPRLRHIAHLGYATIKWSFAVNGLEPPTDPLRLALAAPDDQVWTWGPPEATNSISGSALDFCLLVTQRRHRDDLKLEVAGDQATTYVQIAQAFAGPVGSGRRPLEESR